MLPNVFLFLEYCIDFERGPVSSSPHRSWLVLQTSSLCLITHTYTVCYHDILLNLVIDVFKKGFDCVEVVDTIDAVCDSESEHTELRDDGRCYRPESGENGCFDTEKLTYPVSKWYSCVACSRIPVLSLLANPIVCSIFSCHCTKNVGQTQFHLCDSTHLLGNVTL